MHGRQETFARQVGTYLFNCAHFHKAQTEAETQGAQYHLQTQCSSRRVHERPARLIVGSLSVFVARKSVCVSCLTVLCDTRGFKFAVHVLLHRTVVLFQ